MMLSPRPPTCTRAPSSWPESRPCLPGHCHAVPSQGWGRGLPILSRDSLSCRLRAEGVILQDPQLLWPDADPRSCLRPPPHRPDPKPRAQTSPLRPARTAHPTRHPTQAGMFLRAHTGHQSGTQDSISWYWAMGGGKGKGSVHGLGTVRKLCGDSRT